MSTSSASKQTPLDTNDSFIPEPISGHYDEQVSDVWQQQLPELPSKGIPLLAIMDVLNTLTTKFHHRALKPLGFTHIEYSILSTLLLNGDGVKPSVITDIVGKGSSGTSQALRKLEKNGYVLRTTNAKDKRSVTVKLTKQGSQVAYDLCQSEAELSSKLFNNVDEKQLRQMRESVNNIIDVLVNT